MLPTPLMNILNGGVHADNGLRIQEFMIIPTGAPTFEEAVRCGAEIFAALKTGLKKQGLATSVGDEGGFAPRMESNEAAIVAVMSAIEAAGYSPGKDVHLALDCAASEFFDKKSGKYTFDKKAITGDELVAIYEKLSATYPILSIEDGCSEDDWDTWKKLTDRVGDRIQLVGDDLFVTNVTRLARGIEGKVANAILIKGEPDPARSPRRSTPFGWPRRPGSVSIISHRSGETEDTFIADLAVATSASQIKTGSLSRSDRVAKYNQLLRIGFELGRWGRVRGQDAFPPLGKETRRESLEMSKARVAVLKSKPETILHDVERVCDLAGMQNALAKSRTTILKDDLSWRFPFPAA